MVPSPNATRFEVAIYVEPEYVERMRKAFADTTDNCVILCMEKVVGQHLDDRGPIGKILFSDEPDYGVGVAEAYLEGES